jgi:hypothetical protein
MKKKKKKQLGGLAGTRWYNNDAAMQPMVGAKALLRTPKLYIHSHAQVSLTQRRYYSSIQVREYPVLGGETPVRVTVIEFL